MLSAPTEKPQMDLLLHLSAGVNYSVPVASGLDSPVLPASKRGWTRPRSRLGSDHWLISSNTAFFFLQRRMSGVFWQKLTAYG